MGRYKKVVDRLGKEWNSVKEMCAAYPVGTDVVFNGRIKLGYSLKDALETELKDASSRVVKDHLGKEWSGLGKMCAAYPVKSVNTFNKRKKMGWSLEEILTTSLKSSIVKDHLGNVYNSKQEMCEKYGLGGYHVVAYRLSLGFSLEEALTLEVGALRGKKVKDHLGKEWPSITAMCEAYPVGSISTFTSRCNRGYSLKDALEEKCVNVGTRAGFTDHLGIEWNTITEMCKNYPVGSISTYGGRIKRGWSIKQALETVSGQEVPLEPIDYLGKEWPSAKEMCDAYPVKNVETFRHRLKMGKTLIFSLLGLSNEVTAWIYSESLLTNTVVFLNHLLDITAVSATMNSQPVYYCVDKETKEPLYLTEEHARAYPNGYIECPEKEDE